jgi:hypothetical protein
VVNLIGQHHGDGNGFDLRVIPLGEILSVSWPVASSKKAPAKTSSTVKGTLSEDMVPLNPVNVL